MIKRLISHLDEPARTLSDVFDAAPCPRHKADVGTPCWQVQISATKKLAPAVCGARIKRAGFNGKIDPASLSSKTTRPAPTYGRNRPVRKTK